MVATVLPVWVVRSWASRVRRPLPVRVSIRGTSWVPGGRWLDGAQSGRLAGRGGENARASFPPHSVPFISIREAGEADPRFPGEQSAMLWQRQAIDRAE